MTKLFVSTLAIVLGLALAACDEDDGNWLYDGTTDIGVETPGDVATEPGTDVIPEPTTDIGVETVPDGSGGCDNDLGTFAPSEILAGDMSSIPDVTTPFWTVRSPLPGLTWDSAPFGMVDIEVVHGAGGPSTPTTVNITSYDGRDATSTFIIVLENCTGDISTCQTYIAEQATFTISEIGLSVGSTLRATLSGAIISSWDPGGDVIITGGPQYCLDVWEINTTMTDPTTW